MKIIVNELPNSPNECLFHEISSATRTGCCKLSNSSIECKIGCNDFTCPFLMKFNAEAFKYTYYGDAVTGYIKIPVILKEE